MNLQNDSRVMSSIKKGLAKLIESNVKLYVAATGAGAGIPKLMWNTPGISAIFLGFTLPYNQLEFDRFIGTKLYGGSYASLDGAVALANASYLYAQEDCSRANNLNAQIIGLGLSAAVQTSRERRGEDKVFIAVKTKDNIRTASIIMQKDQFDRVGQGVICDVLGLSMIFSAHDWLNQDNQIGELHLPIELSFKMTGLERIGMPGEEPASILTETTFTHKEAYTLPTLVNPNGTYTDIALDPDIHVVYPGSFAQFHWGHDNIARTVKALGKEPVFEITVNNADKGVIDQEELSRRATQFHGRWPVIVRNDCSLFIDKARAYPGCNFVVGVDTAERLLDQKYYTNGIDSLDQMLLEFKHSGTKFYVISREKNGIFKTCDDLNILAHYEKLFIPLPGRWNISSTQIREATTQ